MVAPLRTTPVMRHPVNSTLVSDAASSTAPARSHRSKRTSRQRNPLRWRPARSALIQTLSRSSTCARCAPTSTSPPACTHSHCARDSRRAGAGSRSPGTSGGSGARLGGTRTPGPGSGGPDGARLGAAAAHRRPGGVPLGPAVASFLAERDLAPSSHRVYVLALGRLLDRLGADTPLSPR